MVGEELASNTALDEVLCVCPGRRPIKSCPEGLADKCPVVVIAISYEAEA